MLARPEENKVTAEAFGEKNQVMFRFSYAEHQRWDGRTYVFDIGIVCNPLLLLLIGSGNKERGIESVQSYLKTAQNNRSRIDAIVNRKKISFLEVKAHDLKRKILKII